MDQVQKRILPLHFTFLIISKLKIYFGLVQNCLGPISTQKDKAFVTFFSLGGAMHSDNITFNFWGLKNKRVITTSETDQITKRGFGSAYHAHSAICNTFFHFDSTSLLYFTFLIQCTCTYCSSIQKSTDFYCMKSKQPHQKHFVTKPCN